jgi:membrane-associated phospholipid phosphatase
LASTNGEHVGLARGAAFLVAFALLTVLVAMGALTSVDRAILDGVQVPHASWLDLAGSVISAFGQSEVVGSIALGVAIVRRRAGRSDWWIPLLLVVVVLIELALKLTVPQPPPPSELSRSVHLLPFIDGPTPFAFPSGHVARTAFLVVALGWPVPLSTVLVAVTSLTTIYLGHHWPSDAVGGWLLGYGIAAVSGRQPRILLRR